MRKFLLFICILFLFTNCEKASESAGSGTTGQGGSLARFTVVGNYLYTVDITNLKVFDVSNPALPVLKNTIPVGFQIETIYPFKDKLFIGSTTVVHIFSIQDPSKPTKLSEAISPTVLRRCDPVVAKDNVAYATLRTNGSCGGTESILAVYDITTITKPVQKFSITLSEPYGLGYAANTLYVCDKNRGLLLFDITDVYKPELIKQLKDGSYIDVIPYGTVLICWTETGLLLYDITTPSSPVLLTTIV